MAIDRALGKEDNGWWAPPGESVTYYFGSPMKLSTVRLVFDSNLHNLKRMPCSYPLKGYDVKIPGMMTRAFDRGDPGQRGQWQIAQRGRGQSPAAGQAPARCRDRRPTPHPAHLGRRARSSVRL